MSVRLRRVAVAAVTLLWLAAGAIGLLTAAELALRARHTDTRTGDPTYRAIEDVYLPFAVQHLHPNYLFWFPFGADERRALNNAVCSLSPDGFRGPGPAERGRRKLAYVLGGSAAFGHFASANDTTITGYLNARQDEYLFVNAGVPSWNSTQELQRLALDLIPSRPALVIAYDGSNDAVIGADYIRRGRRMPAGAPESFDELSDLVDDIRGKPRPGRGSLPRRLFPNVMSIVEAWHGPWAASAGASVDPARPPLAQVVSDDAARYIENVSTMALLTKATGARFIGVFQPVLPLHAHRPADGPCDRDGLQRERELFHQTVMASLPTDVEYDDFASLFDRFFETVPRFCPASDAPLTDQVFVDAVHLFDPGNKIVAEELWRRVQAKPGERDTN